MRKICFLFGVLFGFQAYLAAQQTKGAAPVATASAVATGQSWAVVVGVSNYQNANITDLQYADRDAEAFVQFLRSPAGGGVPDDHITLLLNENATRGKFAIALDWLLENAQKGDQAIIYFSGHGDVEKKIVSQPGYLLCVDAPAQVYMAGGALNLRDLQDIISSLCIQNEAKVVVIADACRSGNLAGNSIGGNLITAENLAKQYQNEVKLMSCAPSELALEGAKWGGGRGVFSYYLLNGLAGQADQNNDGQITLKEIERFLEDQVPAATAPHPQNPRLLASDKLLVLGKADAATLVALQQTKGGSNAGSDLIAARNASIEQALEADPNALALYQEFKNALKDKRLLQPETNSAWTLYGQLKDRASMIPFQGLMRRNLAAALQDEAQQAMNAYLVADATEMRKRWNLSDRYYEQFPEYLHKAAELMGESSQEYNSLKARAHYFTALNYRLRGQKTKMPALYQLALQEIQECLKREPNAAYAFNERGLLRRRLKMYKEAVTDFEQAFLHSPGWVLPWANLCSTYNDLEEYDKAEIAGKQAVKLDKNSGLAHYNLGLTYHNTGNIAAAKSQYEEAIRADSLYTAAYFNLGLLHYWDNEFEKAELAWTQYQVLEPNDADNYLNLGEIALKRGQKDKALSMYQKSIELDPKSFDGHFAIGVLWMNDNQHDKADAAFWRCVEMSPDSPVGYYCLALNEAFRNKPDVVEKHMKKAIALDKNFEALRQDKFVKDLLQIRKFMELLDQYAPGWKG